MIGNKILITCTMLILNKINLLIKLVYWVTLPKTCKKIYKLYLWCHINILILFKKYAVEGEKGIEKISN